MLIIPKQFVEEAKRILIEAGFDMFELGGGPGYEDNSRKEKVPYTKQPIPPELRWAVWERDNFTCQRCGSRRHLAVDHKHPESKGGTLDMDNLQTLCVPCNTKKGTK